MGKIQKAALRETYAGLYGAAAVKPEKAEGAS
jgi:hypothetical protein